MLRFSNNTLIDHTTLLNCRISTCAENKKSRRTPNPFEKEFPSTKPLTLSGEKKNRPLLLSLRLLNLVRRCVAQEASTARARAASTTSATRGGWGWRSSRLSWKWATASPSWSGGRRAPEASRRRDFFYLGASWTSSIFAKRARATPTSELNHAFIFQETRQDISRSLCRSL